MSKQKLSKAELIDEFHSMPADLPCLTVAHLRALTGLSDAYFARERSVTGEGPRFTKLGNRVRYKRSDIEAWLKEKEVA